MKIEREEDIFDAAYNMDKEQLIRVLEDHPEQINLRFDPENDKMSYDVEGRYILPIEALIINSDYRTSLAEENAKEMFDILIKHGAVLNYTSTYENNTMLHAAADSGNSYIAKKVIEAGVDVNALDIDGNTALHLAVGNMRIDTIKVLLKHGAEASTIIQNKRGQLPINSVKEGHMNDSRNEDKIKKIKDILGPITEDALKKEFSSESPEQPRKRPKL